MKKFLLVLILLIIPIVLVLTARVIKQDRGLYWMYSNKDPDYAYLFNGLNVINGLKIGHIDHPGTPVQVFASLVLRAEYQLRHKLGGVIALDVVENPEIYLGAISNTLTGLIVGLVFVSGLAVWLTAQNIGLSLLVQSGPYFAATILFNGLAKVSPEPMLLLASLALTIALFVYLSNTKIRAEFFGLALGLIIGLGLASKINFLPLAVIPLILLKKLPAKLIALGATAVGFIFFTWPIKSQYDHLFAWVRQIIDHSGKHGGGTAQVIEPALYWQHLKILNDIFPYLGPLLLVVFLLLAVSLVSPTKRHWWRIPAFRAMVAIGLAQLGGILIVAKHMGEHYLLPTVSLSATLTAMIVLFILKSDLAGRTRLISYLLLAWLTIGSLVRTATDFTHIAADYRLHLAETLKEYDIPLDQGHNFATLAAIKSRETYLALRFGDSFAGSQYTDLIDRIYPDQPIE